MVMSTPLLITSGIMNLATICDVQKIHVPTTATGQLTSAQQLDNGSGNGRFLNGFFDGMMAKSLMYETSSEQLSDYTLTILLVWEGTKLKQD